MPHVRPKNERRVYVTATDGKTRKSKHTTVYDATPQQVIELIERGSASGLKRARVGQEVDRNAAGNAAA